MPRLSCSCDQCGKYIGNDQNAWFSDASKDLDLCSSACYNQYHSNYNYCRESSCLTKVYGGSQYCSSHSHYGHYCLANSCYNKIPSYQTYCSLHNENDELKSLVKNRTNISGNVEEVERFTTWWNNNLATVIAYYDGYYRAFLLVYVKENDSVKVFPRDSSSNYWGEHSRKQHNYLSDAKKSETSWLRNELSKGYGKYHDHPILLIHPASDCSHSFDSFVCEPYVIKGQIGSSTKNIDIPLFFVSYSASTPSDLNRCFKPLDIVWVKCVDDWIGKRFYHVGVYLGNDKICHFSRKNNLIENTSWENFLSNTTRKIIRYHPIIPFEHYQAIIRRTVWAKDKEFRKGSYNLANRNCEHLANMLVYGVDFSQQVYERRGEMKTKAGLQTAGFLTYGTTMATTSIALAPFTFGLSLIPGAFATAATVACIDDQERNHFTLNNNKEEVHLENEIRNTNNRLGKKSDRETEKYENQYLIQVPPKDSCQIM